MKWILRAERAKTYYIHCYMAGNATSGGKLPPPCPQPPPPIRYGPEQNKTMLIEQIRSVLVPKKQQIWRVLIIIQKRRCSFDSRVQQSERSRHKSHLACKMQSMFWGIRMKACIAIIWSHSRDRHCSYCAIQFRWQLQETNSWYNPCKYRKAFKLSDISAEIFPIWIPCLQR